jgi:hypothetical protein
MFFTQPIRLGGIAHALRRRSAAVPAELPENEAKRGTSPRRGAQAEFKPTAPDSSPSNIEISEQPIDTLPAELQDELMRTATPRAARPVDDNG